MKDVEYAKKSCYIAALLAAIVFAFMCTVSIYKETPSKNKTTANTTAQLTTKPIATITTTIASTTTTTTTMTTTEVHEYEIDKKEANGSVERVELTSRQREDNADKKKTYLGTFKITAYCGCKECNGEWYGSPTASGAYPQSNHTIAVDTNIIPLGTKVLIDDIEYVAEDTGSAVKGNIIDIYFDSHSDAEDFGVQYAEVYIVE